MGQAEINDNKKLLDIYYYLNFDDTYDIDFIERSIELNIKVYEKNYNVNKIIKYIDNHDFLNTSKIDSIKRGLLIFNMMFKTLKLKGVDDVWFMYLSNANIQNDDSLGDNVFITLLNKNPSVKKSSYALNKFVYSIRKNKIQSKSNTDLIPEISKLEQMRKVNETLKNAIVNTKSITYDDL